MKKILGISGILIFVFVLTSILRPQFVQPDNIRHILRETGFFGIISIGVAFVIITGGIDLSVGSVVGLAGCLLPWFLETQHWPLPVSFIAVLAISVLVGLFHGVLITKVRLQPFIVTLCGMLFYRGFARWLTKDQTQGFGDGYPALKQMASGIVSVGGGYAIPVPFIIMSIIGVLAAIFLNRTIWGRYLLALGRNEEAARFSGIDTERMVLIAYVICALLSGFGGMLFAIDVNSVAPSNHGNFYEVYAIAAAVLGGCSLRGGEGSIFGVVVGAALMRVLLNSINVLKIATQLEYAIIGGVILAGAIADEMIRRYAKRRREIGSAPS